MNTWLPVRLALEPPPPARPPRRRLRPWEVERARLKRYQARRRRDDRPVDGFDYAGFFARLDPSIEKLKGHLARERAERVAPPPAALDPTLNCSVRVARGGGEV